GKEVSWLEHAREVNLESGKQRRIEFLPDAVGSGGGVDRFCEAEDCNLLHGGIDNPHLLDATAAINFAFDAAVQFGRSGRENLHNKVRGAPHALPGKDRSPRPRDVIQVGLINVQIGQLNVRGSEVHRTQRVVFQVARQDGVQVAEDLLMEAVGRWRHVEVSFNEQVLSRAFVQSPIISGG